MSPRHHAFLAVLPAVLWLIAAPGARAISLVVHLHYESFAAPGQQEDEANLVGWRVSLESAAGVPLADLGVTGAGGDTVGYDTPAGSYIVTLALPEPYPYDDDAIWPTNLRFPFTLEATDAQGQPLATYRVRIGLGCGCDDGDQCTNDLCDAGRCSTTPNLRPELPELCDGIDNDCDGSADEGLPKPCGNNLPELIGCADGTREGFMDFARYPYVAACGGAWDRPGLDGAALAPSCDRRAGNHGANQAGAGCRAVDLCAPGWHVCRGPDDLGERASSCADAVDTYYPNFGTGDYGVGNAGPLAPYPGGAFFLARGALGGECADAVNGLPTGAGGIFGCGNLGLLDTRCGKFTRSAGSTCAGLRDLIRGPGDNPATDWAYDLPSDWAWSCAGGQAGDERARIVKGMPDRQGGVLCCRDAALGLPEVCDGIDNDLDGVVDDLAGRRVGQSCPLAEEQCGALECTGDGALACVDPAACDDSMCDDQDDDGDGETDEGFEPGPTTCGVGACAATGERTCVDGAEVDSCVPGSPLAERDTTCDRRDDDCDGLTDEDWVDAATTCGLGVCQAHGVRRCVDGGEVDSCAPGLPLSDIDATCNGIDEDCSGQADDDWVETPTSCGQGSCAGTGVLACIAGVPTNTCEPGGAGANDDDCDGADDDCDGLTDEDFEPHVSACGLGVCVAEGFATCEGGALHDDCVPLEPPISVDDVCNGVDDDCDGATDDDFAGAPVSCGQGGCMRPGAVTCVAGEERAVCEPGKPADDDVACDGVDEDCDGETDEDYQAIETMCGLGACEGNRGEAMCQDGAVADSCDAFAGATSETCDGNDDDCDGDTDEDFGAVGEACDGDDADRCAEGTLRCSEDATAASCDESGEGRLEVCNGVDDDCDGETDEALGECGDGDGDGLPDPIDNCPAVANAEQADGDGDGLGDACDQLIQGAGGDCAGGAAAGGAGWLLLALAIVLRLANPSPPRGRSWSRREGTRTLIATSSTRSGSPRA